MALAQPEVDSLPYASAGNVKEGFLVGAARERELMGIGMIALPGELLKPISSYTSQTPWTMLENGGVEDLAPHAAAVEQISVMMAGYLGMSAEQIATIRRGALLHDIGKIPNKDLFNLHRRHTDAEIQLRRTHSVDGWAMLKTLSPQEDKGVLDIVLFHHEKVNGLGYLGLRGQEIPFPAQVVSGADVLDALMNRAIYKHLWSSKEVATLFEQNRGGDFHPEVARVVVEHLDTLVEASRLARSMAVQMEKLHNKGAEEMGITKSDVKETERDPIHRNVFYIKGPVYGGVPLKYAGSYVGENGRRGGAAIFNYTGARVYTQ